MNPFRRPTDPRAERTTPRAEAPLVRVEGATATLRLYDPIDSWGGPWGVSAREFTTSLDELPPTVAEIRLLINSPGGEVHEGIAIANALRAHPARIVATVEGLAASSASFIAASADELVMMRNSQLYIHNAWTIVMGDAADLRHAADELETYFDRNIASIYAAKTGDTVEHWLEQMHADRFLSADEAVAERLADRIEGEADVAAARARFDLSVFNRAERPNPTPAAPAALNLPSSTEPGDPNRREELEMSDILAAGLRERLGVSDASLSDEQLLAAVDEVLAEQSDTPTTATLPEGTTLIDSAVLAELRAAGAAGVQALQQQATARRERTVQAALNDGRIAIASRATWLAQLEANEEGTTALLDSLPKNTIPVAELGRSDEPSDSDELYAAAWGSKKKEA